MSSTKILTNGIEDIYLEDVTNKFRFYRGTDPFRHGREYLYVYETGYAYPYGNYRWTRLIPRNNGFYELRGQRTVPTTTEALAEVDAISLLHAVEIAKRDRLIPHANSMRRWLPNSEK
jgi:hypothetical protein